MSGNIPNELTVYLRPQEAIQPYVIAECARWMVRTGKAPCVTLATRYLRIWENENPSQFKYMISEYHRHNDYQSKSATNFRRNINVAYSTPGPYGEDDHMHYNRGNLHRFLD